MGMPEKKNNKNSRNKGDLMLKSDKKWPDLNIIQAAIESENPELLPWYSVSYDKNGNVKSVQLIPGILAEYIKNSHYILHAAGVWFFYEHGAYREWSWEQACGFVKSFTIPRFVKVNVLHDAVEQVKLLVLASQNTLNPEEWIINLRDGLFDFKRGILEEHDPEYLSTVQLGTEYGSGENCPKWEKFIRESVAPENILLAQQIMGYMLVPITCAQKAFILLGPGGSGKSTYLYVLHKLLGDSNVSHIELQGLSDRFKTAELFGKLANIFADLPSRPIENPSTFKALTGEDFLTVERKHAHPFSFQNKARLIFSANELPRSPEDRSDAFYRRLVILPFPNKRPIEQWNTDLKEELLDELPGILVWALNGLADLYGKNFRFRVTASTDGALETYKKDNSNVRLFVENCLILGERYTTSRNEIFDNYKRFCQDANLRAVSQPIFVREVEEILPELKQARHPITKRMVWIGVSLMSEGKSEGW